jgi:8-oxo-dGTP pyrophosphatase MutT (NUDIX family)
MPSRTDYFHDPGAPIANSVAPAACLFVEDETGHLLMIERSDSGLWAVPGGALELGESIAATAARETFEETGIIAHVTGFVGVFSDPGVLVAYADGEVRQEFSVALSGRPIGGHLRPSTESNRVAWINRAELPELRMADAMRRRVDVWLSATVPYIG